MARRNPDEQGEQEGSGEVVGFPGGDEQKEEPRVQDTDKIRREIRKAFKEMDTLSGQRDELNEQANEIRARMKNKGIPTKAFNAAYSRYSQDEEKREAFDFAFALCCNSVGVGYQPELFDAVEAEAAE